MSSFTSENENNTENKKEGHGVGDRDKYYGKWDKFAHQTEAELDSEEQEAVRLEKERVAHIPQSDAHKRDQEKREALKEAKKQWDKVQANEKMNEITFDNENGVENRVIDAAAMGGKRVLFINNSTNSSYVLAPDLVVTKVFIDDCKNCTFRLNCKIATSVIEVHRCDNVSLHIVTQAIHTIQVDMSENISVCYNKGLFSPDTKIYHSSVKGMTVSYDYLGTGVESDFKSQTLDDLELSHVIDKTRPPGSISQDDQFVTAFLTESQELVTDYVLRDGSGHPTTARELEDRKRSVLEAAAAKGLDVNLPEVQKLLHEYDPYSPLQLGQKYKDEGNKAFKECDYRQASVHYTQAVDLLHSLHTSESTELTDILKASLSNRAACSLKLGDHENALADANACLDIDPTHVKATFRKGMALHAMERYREACPVLSKALQMEPKNTQIKAALTFAERRAMMPGSK